MACSTLASITPLSDRRLMASKLPLTETVGMALNTLRANRLRSLLTMLGIVIGNASVITLVGVGRGAQNLAEDQLSNLGFVRSPRAPCQCTPLCSSSHVAPAHPSNAPRASPR